MKGTVIAILSDHLCKDGSARFTTVTLTSDEHDQYELDINVYNF